MQCVQHLLKKVNDLRREARDLKACVACLTLKGRQLQKQA